MADSQILNTYDRRPPEPPRGNGLKLAVISDLHLGWSSENRDTGFMRECLTDLETMPDIDLLVLNGDINGRELDTYTRVQGELLANLKCHSYYLSGNVEARTPETLQRYFEISKRPLDGILFLRGIRMVFLGVPVYGHEIPIEPARVDRFGRSLDEENATTLVFHHLPLADTVFNSGDYLAKFPGYYPFNTRVPDSTPIMEILRRHPEVKLWVSGHNHPKHDGVDRMGYGTTRPEGECLHLAVCNLGYKEPSPEGRFIFVEDDRILVRTRNFLRREWIEEQTYEIPGKTGLTAKQ